MSRRPLLPPQPFLGALLRRTVLAWFFLRFIATRGLDGSGLASPAELAGTLTGQAWVVAFVLAAVWIDLRRRGETVFLANLGFGKARVAGLILAVCFTLEVALGLLVA